MLPHLSLSLALCGLFIHHALAGHTMSSISTEPDSIDEWLTHYAEPFESPSSASISPPARNVKAKTALQKVGHSAAEKPLTWIRESAKFTEEAPRPHYFVRRHDRLDNEPGSISYLRTQLKRSYNLSPKKEQKRKRIKRGKRHVRLLKCIPLYCPVCGYTHRDRGTRDQHIRRHYQSGAQQCHVPGCGVVYNSFEEHDIHFIVHNSMFGLLDLGASKQWSSSHLDEIERIAETLAPTPQDAALHAAVEREERQRMVDLDAETWMPKDTVFADVRKDELSSADTSQSPFRWHLQPKRSAAGHQLTNKGSTDCPLCGANIKETGLSLNHMRSCHDVDTEQDEHGRPMVIFVSDPSASAGHGHYACPFCPKRFWYAECSLQHATALDIGDFAVPACFEEKSFSHDDICRLDIEYGKMQK